MYLCLFFFLMLRRPPISTRTDTLFPTRRSSDLAHVARGHHGLALEVAAALRKHLVLDMQARRAGSLVGADGAPDIGHAAEAGVAIGDHRSEEHTSELQSLMRISYAVFCLKKTKQ